MNEFGECPSFYIWPSDHVDGTPFPDDFYERLSETLRAAGFGMESV